MVWFTRYCGHVSLWQSMLDPFHMQHTHTSIRISVLETACNCPYESVYGATANLDLALGLLLLYMMRAISAGVVICSWHWEEFIISHTELAFSIGTCLSTIASCSKARYALTYLTTLLRLWTHPGTDLSRLLCVLHNWQDAGAAAVVIINFAEENHPDEILAMGSDDTDRNPSIPR